MISIRELNGMKLKDLLKLEGELKEAIVERKQTEAKEVRNEVTEFLSRRGFKLEDLGFTRGHKGYKSQMAPKYRNPKNPKETWSGHGRKSDWLVKQIASGAKLDDFRV